MARVACVDVPALPLQLLLRTHPKWRSHPVVVVKDDRPQGEILWVNELARRHRIAPGMTFAAGRNLAFELRAGVVTPLQIDEAVGELFAVLCGFSPAVEPSHKQPGTFWLDPTGLTTLYGSLEQWADTVRKALAARFFDSSIAIGFHRHRCHAIARCFFGTKVSHDPHREARLVARLPLSRMDLPPTLRDGLAILGVHHIGDLSRFSAAQLRMRFGQEAELLKRRFADDDWSPLSPRPFEEPIETTIQLDPPDDDRSRILFAFKRALQLLLRTLADKCLSMSALRLTLNLERASKIQERLEPAQPTLDILIIVDLVRLRLESIRLSAGVESLSIQVEAVTADPKQLALFAVRQRRDLEAARRALARIRAMLGAEAVTRPQLRAAHLPEASFSWEPTSSIVFPKTDLTPPEGQAPLVRTLLSRPTPLPNQTRNPPESWLQNDPPLGTVDRLFGPFRISGGWWIKMVERDYFYAETREGDLLWLFYDRPRRRWYLHGFVE